VIGRTLVAKFTEGNNFVKIPPMHDPWAMIATLVTEGWVW